MPSIHIDSMQWSDIEDKLKAFSHSQDNMYILVNPETGKRIEFENIQLLQIGLTTEKSSQHKHIGFILPPNNKNALEREPDSRRYDYEALLILRPNPELLPEELQAIKTWVVSVTDAANMDKYVPIAEFLIETFGVEIYMTATQTADPDPDHSNPEPADPRYPNVLPMCRIYRKK